MGRSDNTAGHQRTHIYIDVIMKDGTYHHFTPQVLDVLLESNRVLKFKRDHGWATVGVDPVRKAYAVKQSGRYNGPERRRVIV